MTDSEFKTALHQFLKNKLLYIDLSETTEEKKLLERMAQEIFNSIDCMINKFNKIICDEIKDHVINKIRKDQSASE